MVAALPLQVQKVSKEWQAQVWSTPYVQSIAWGIVPQVSALTQLLKKVRHLVEGLGL
jgi:hypothetical protein